MRRLIILALIISVAFSFTPGRAALAQAGHFETDFETGLPPEMSYSNGPPGCTVADVLGGPGSISSPGLGHGASLESLDVPTPWESGQPFFTSVRIVFPNLVDIASGSVRIYYEVGGNHYGGFGTVTCDADGNQVSNNISYPHAGDAVHALPTDSDIAAIYFYWYAIPVEAENYGYLDDIEIDYTDTGIPFDHELFDDIEGATRYKPVSTPDIFSIVDDNRTVWANKENPNVHSITFGEITRITHNMLGGSTWAVTVSPAWAQTDADRLVYENLQSVNGKLGDQVAAGCVLGLAVTSSTEGSYPVGKLTMSLPTSIQEDWPDYPDSPSNLPCDVDEQTTPNCVDLNPNLANNAESWNFDGHVEAGPQGVTVFSNAALYQDVTLDDVNAYTVTILATTTLGTTSATIDVTFGEATASLHLSAPGAMQFVELKTQPLSIGAADYAPDLYRLRIQNTAPPGHLATPVLIKFICIGTTAVAYAPGSCYFPEPDVNMRADGWEKDTGVTYNPPFMSGFSGSYTLPATLAIWHGVDISAFADADTDFMLHVRSTPGAGTPLLAPYGRFHAFIRDPITLDVLQEIGTWDTGAVVVTAYRADFTLTEGEHVVGDLVIQNITDEIDATGWDLKIEQACLSVEGGVWPGYENTDTDNLFVADCVICSPPGTVEDITTENLLSWVVMWLQYGWCYLGYILRCLILSTLNTIWAAVLSVIAGIGLFGIWAGRVIGVVAAWVSDGARFHFNNLIAAIIPIVNSVLAWLFAQPFFIDVLDGISLALIWFEAIIQIIVGIIGLFGLAIQFVGAMLNLVGIVWSTIIEGLQGTSTVTFPFPDCTNPATPFYDACLPLDVSNFIFSEIPALAILINAAAFAMAWKTMRKAWRRAQEALNS